MKPGPKPLTEAFKKYSFQMLWLCSILTIFKLLNPWRKTGTVADNISLWRGIRPLYSTSPAAQAKICIRTTIQGHTTDTSTSYSDLFYTAYYIPWKRTLNCTQVETGLHSRAPPPLLLYPTLQRKSELCIPIKEIALPHSKFLHSYICTHCKKKFSDFPVPSRDVTNQTLNGRE